MKLKAAVRYQAMELLTSALVFCGVIAALMIATYIIAATSGGVFIVSGISALGFAFIGILAFTTFDGDLRFLLQNGLTRTQVLASCAISFLLAILLLTVMDAVCAAFLSGWARQSLFFGLYGMDQGALLGFLWTFLAYVAFTAVVFALAALRMRIGRKPFLAAFAITALVILLGPAVGQSFFGSVELYLSSVEPLLRLVSAAFGFTSGGVRLLNPIILFVVVTALAALAASLLTRRCEVR